MADDFVPPFHGPVRGPIEHYHHTRIEGFICPANGKFMVVDHFLDRGCPDGFPESEHRPALQVIDIYVHNERRVES